MCGRIFAFWLAAAMVHPVLPVLAGEPSAEKPPNKPGNRGDYYLRSGSKDDENCMGFRCGPVDNRGHCDPLSITLAAFGRTLLIDPGAATGGAADSAELDATRSHNTITVDNLDSRGSTLAAWVSLPGFDFVAGTNSGYEGLENVLHHRRVWLLKAAEKRPGPDVWLVFDDVEGTGEHQVDLRYRIAPVKITSDPDCGCVWTTEDKSNLYIHVASQPRAALHLVKTNPPGPDLREVPLATYSVKANLPVSMTSILSPGRTRDPISWHEQLLACEPSAPDARAIWLERDNDAVLAACNRFDSLETVGGDTGGLPASAGTGGQAASGTILLISLPDGRKLQADAAGVAMRFRKSSTGWVAASVHAVRAGEIQLDGRRLHPARIEHSIDQALP